MAFITLEYSLEESNIYSNCTIDDIILDGHQSCTIDIPSDFVGKARSFGHLSSWPNWSAGDTLSVSWECNPAFHSFEIHLFVPLIFPTILFISFVLSWLCIARYTVTAILMQWLWLNWIWLVTIMVSIIASYDTNLSCSFHVHSIMQWCRQGGACGFICTQSMHLCTHPMHV